MKIKEIYEKYQIPPNLQDHMYRVAAVGSLVVDYIQDRVKLDKDLVTKTLLLHDIGNIIKFDFKNEEFYSNRNTEYWKKVKEEFVKKYGTDEHKGTIAIIKELNLPKEIVGILENIHEYKINGIINENDWYVKICSYADFRVAPYGVVSLEKRFDDILKRYKESTHVLAKPEITLQYKKISVILEKQIQEKSSRPLARISDELIAPLVAKLPEYDIV